MQRTRKPSYKTPGLPNIRPCRECGEERPIVARDMCDRCRKREERKEAGLNIPACGNKQTQAKGMKALGVLVELMNKFGLHRSNREDSSRCVRRMRASSTVTCGCGDSQNRREQQ